VKAPYFGFFLPLRVTRGSTSGASDGGLQTRKPGTFSVFILISRAYLELWSESLKVCCT